MVTVLVRISSKKRITKVFLKVVAKIETFLYRKEFRSSLSLK